MRRGARGKHLAEARRRHRSRHRNCVGNNRYRRRCLLILVIVVGTIVTLIADGPATASRNMRRGARRGVRGKYLTDARRRRHHSRHRDRCGNHRDRR